jgi:hypothetical protein
MTRTELHRIAAALDAVGIVAYATGPRRVPLELFDTYSALANTTGGRILLATDVREHERLDPDLPEIDCLEAQLRAELDEGFQLSVDLIGHSGIRRIEIDGHALLRIDVPPAPVGALPVHLRGTFAQTFVRVYGANHRVGVVPRDSPPLRVDIGPDAPPSMTFPRPRTKYPPEEIDRVRRLLDALDLHINDCFVILRERAVATDRDHALGERTTERLAAMRSVRGAILHGLFTGRFLPSCAA